MNERSQSQSSPISHWKPLPAAIEFAAYFLRFTEARRPHVEKLLIVGIDTLAGSNLALTLADRCNIVGISDRSGFELPGCRTLPIRSSASEAVGESIVADARRGSFTVARPPVLVGIAATSNCSHTNLGKLGSSMRPANSATAISP